MERIPNKTIRKAEKTMEAIVVAPRRMKWILKIKNKSFQFKFSILFFVTVFLQGCYSTVIFLSRSFYSQFGKMQYIK